MREHDRLYIGGALVAPAGTGVIEVRSPATEELVGRVPDGTPADIDRAVAAARRAFDEGPWPRMSPGERGDVLARLNDALGPRVEELATVQSLEVGSPITFSMSAGVSAATMIVSYYAELARTFVFDELRDGLLGQTWVLREPCGVAAAIVPWNVPLFVTLTKLMPALVAGCAVVLKPPPETPLYAYLLAEALDEAGVPPGVVNIVAGGRELGEHLVTHPGVDKVSFTGSTGAGKRVASLCGELLRPVTLELGGKSAAILLDDVDLDAKIPELLPFAMMNTGQACIAQTRILASRRRYEEVVAAVTEEVKRQKQGDPMDPEVFVGPVIAERQRARVEALIAKGREEGARITTGGGRPPGHERGWWVEPTVFAGVKPEMTIAQEEIFGPVLSILAYEDDDDAVRIANASRYGLSGSVWTSDRERGLSIARRVKTGTYTIDGYVLDFAAPFGGYRESGLGREFGPEGLMAYLQYKSVNLV
ncbi:MAG: aldehyde dehydrogenase [Polyangiaceae bacterium]|nr:aldehyde dehydrogenase [Polyangiaceae bacterium]